MKQTVLKLDILLIYLFFIHILNICKINNDNRFNINEVHIKNCLYKYISNDMLQKLEQFSVKKDI